MLKLTSTEITLLQKVLTPENFRVLSGPVSDLNWEAWQQLSRKVALADKIILYVDGAADLEHKIAGIGGVLYRDGTEIATFSEAIGSATNNVAEYRALLRGLELVTELDYTNCRIFMDSELVVRQIMGEYKVRKEHLKGLYQEALDRLERLQSWSLQHVSRTENKVADRLSKAGMLKEA